MLPVDAVIFDLGNVLVRFSHARMHAQLAAATGLAPEAVRAFFAEAGRGAAYERGDLDDDAALVLLAARAGRTLDRAAVHEALSDIFDPMPEMVALVGAVQATGRKVGLLSNTIPPHVAHLRRRWPEVVAPFDALTLSYEARANKPEPAIYRAALAALGVSAARAWFVDDLPENVAGAVAAGLRASRFLGHAELVAEFRAAGLLPAATP